MTRYYSWIATVIVAVTICLPCSVVTAADKPTTQPVFETLEQLAAYYAQQKEDAQKRIARDELAALQTFALQAEGEEHEAALIGIMRLAAVLDDVEMILTTSTEYMKQHADHPRIWSARLSHGFALARLCRLDEAAKEWGSYDQQLDSTSGRALIQMGMYIASGYAECGRFDELKPFSDQLYKRFEHIAQAKEAILNLQDLLYWADRDVPVVEGKDLDGKEINVEKDYAGKIVVICFFKASEPRKMVDLQGLKDAYTAYHAKGLEILGISLDDDVAVAKEFVEKRSLPWRVICDEAGTLGANARKFDVLDAPMTLVVGRDGKVCLATGLVPGFTPSLKRLLDHLAAVPADAK